MARPRPGTALAPTAPATLTRDQRTLLAEALRQAEATREVIEDKLVDFGRWLLIHVFDDDAHAALEQKRTNPVWREIIDRAGGPTLRLSPRLVHVAIDIAAHDHRITDQSWRLLEPGRKELLLPLGEEALLQKAAKHVVALKLSHRATEQYVTSLRAAAGTPRTPRVSVPRFHASLKRFHGRVADPAYRKKLEKSLEGLPGKQKIAMRKDIEALRDWAAHLAATLKE